jgi:hypothetical protein
VKIKRFLLFLLVTSLFLFLAACGSEESEAKEPENLYEDDSNIEDEDPTVIIGNDTHELEKENIADFDGAEFTLGDIVEVGYGSAPPENPEEIGIEFRVENNTGKVINVDPDGNIQAIVKDSEGNVYEPEIKIQGIKGYFKGDVNDNREAQIPFRIKGSDSYTIEINDPHGGEGKAVWKFDPEDIERR